MPFIVLLAISGAMYLFKPQIDAWLDHPYDHLHLSGKPTKAYAQVQAALAAVPESTLSAYELPNVIDGATRVIVNHHGERIRVYVHPESLEILKVIPEEDRFTRIIFKFHGELLMGNIGSGLVELAASWAIVMIMTGLYLWWPRNQNGWGEILFPRFRFSGRAFGRDLHAVTGFWISGFVLFLLITGLPWAKVWGEYFKEVRRLTGTAVVEQDWTVGATPRVSMPNTQGEHQDHSPQGTNFGEEKNSLLNYAPIDILVGPVRALNLPSPVFISPPSKPGGYWTAKSDTQNRPQRVKLILDASTGTVLKREDFQDRHFFDRLIGIGVAAHEGQLFGWPNVALGLFTACGLLTLVTSGITMWWRRRPSGHLGAPLAPPSHVNSAGFIIMILLLGLYLPLYTASLITILIIEKLLLKKIPSVAVWLGLRNHPF